MTDAAISLTEREADEVRAILGRLLPRGVRTYVFGSRAGGRVKPWSDLDLAFRADEALPFSTLSRLAQAFDDSDLLWKVDLVDLNSVGTDFARIIEATKVPFE